MNNSFFILAHLTKCRSKTAVLEALAEVLSKQMCQPMDEVLDHLLERESISDTALEKGLALPHFIHRDCQAAQVCIATLAEEVVDWLCVDHSKVSLLVCLIIPENYTEQTEGIAQVTAVMRLLADTEFIESINGLTVECIEEKMRKRLEQSRFL